MDVAPESGYGLGQELGLVVEGGVNHSAAHRDIVEGLHNRCHGPVIRPEASRDGNYGGDAAGYHKAEGIGRCKGGKRFYIIESPHYQGAGEPETAPYRNGVQDEQPGPFQFADCS